MSKKATMRLAREKGASSWAAAMLPPIVPRRIAAKVAASMSALPPVSSLSRS